MPSARGASAPRAGSEGRPQGHSVGAGNRPAEPSGLPVPGFGRMPEEHSQGCSRFSRGFGPGCSTLGSSQGGTSPRRGENLGGTTAAAGQRVTPRIGGHGHPQGRCESGESSGTGVAKATSMKNPERAKLRQSSLGVLRVHDVERPEWGDPTPTRRNRRRVAWGPAQRCAAWVTDPRIQRAKRETGPRKRRAKREIDPRKRRAKLPSVPRKRISDLACRSPETVLHSPLSPTRATESAARRPERVAGSGA